MKVDGSIALVTGAPAGGVASRLRLLRRFAPAVVMDVGIRHDLRLDVPMTHQSRLAALAE